MVSLHSLFPQYYAPFSCYFKIIWKLCQIKLNRWQNFASVTDVRTSPFGFMCNALWMLQFNRESDSEGKQRAEIVDHFIMNLAALWQNQQSGTCAQQRLRSAWVSAQSGHCPVWSESSLCTQWVAKDPSFLHADSEDSDQTGRMPRLIWVFPGRTCHFVGFVMRQLN